MSDVCPACSLESCEMMHGWACTSRQLEQSKGEARNLRKLLHDFETDGRAEHRTCDAELASARQLAFPGTHTERGPEDDDEVCDVCSHSAEAGKHTYRDCVANFESVNAQVNGYLSGENEKLNAELASSRAQVELTEAERRLVEAAVLERSLRAECRATVDRATGEYWAKRNAVDKLEHDRDMLTDELLALRAKP